MVDIYRKVNLSIIVILLIIVLVSCNKHKPGSLEDAEMKILSTIGVSLSDFELINTIYKPESKDQFILDIDGRLIENFKVRYI